MSQELFWLTLTAFMTALFWIPYILHRIAKRGLMGAMANPSPDAVPVDPWADRAQRAHDNAIENLAVFAPLVIAVQMTGMNSALTAGAAMLFFFARLAHYAVFTLGLPVVRTLAFAAGFLAQAALALRLLGVL